MRKYMKTRNLSASQTLQYFNTSQNNLKSKDSDQLKLEDIKLIYNFLYDDNFSNILIQSKDSFKNSIEFNIKDIIKYHFEEIYINSQIFQETINKFRKEIEEKYLKDFSILNEEFQKNKNLKEEERQYLKHFKKHCINTEEYAYHHCPNNKKGKFILVEEKNIRLKSKKPEIKFVICIECKRCYPSTCINMICAPCNHEYFSMILKEYEDENIVLATWEKYHCGVTLMDQVMKCIKCKKELYLNLITNKLICQNKKCNFEAKPNSILWKCSLCYRDFRSKAKPYNPLEFKIMKKAINNTLIMKIRAIPKYLPCCKKDTKNLVFFHKEECKGKLYKGFLAGKEILVCKKCHAMNFIDKFNWICPLCSKKFHLHHISSVTPFKAKKYVLNKENVNNSNKKPTRIYFIPKETSPLFKNNLGKIKDISKDKDISKENINILNNSKDSEDQKINSYKNIKKLNNINNTNIIETEKNKQIKMVKISQNDIKKNEKNKIILK